MFFPGSLPVLRTSALQGLSIIGGMALLGSEGGGYRLWRKSEGRTVPHFLGVDLPFERGPLLERQRFWAEVQSFRPTSVRKSGWSSGSWLRGSVSAFRFPSNTESRAQGFLFELN